VAQALLDDIGRGRLKPGDRLPTEDALGQSFGVSRITVRQAFDILRQRGLVERTAGRGSFVTSPPGTYVMTAASIEDVVLAGADTALRVLAWEAVRPGPDVERRLGRPGQRAWVLRSIRRRDGAVLCYSETYTPYDVGRRLDPEVVRRQTVLETIERDLGIQVGRATEEISAGAADGALAAHLGVPVGSPLVVVEMTCVDVSGRVIEYYRTSYRADRFKRRTVLERVRPAAAPPGQGADGTGARRPGPP
jgi:GntR family transcriptional regulator